MNSNWEEEFDSIVSGLDMDEVESLPEDLTLWELHRAILGMNEVSMWLGSASLDIERDEDLDLPEPVVVFIREIIALTSTLSDILSECECEDCQTLFDEMGDDEDDD